ncbi:MAG: hypothetical protein K8I04_03775 [Gammaproteobacteria bacterium]|nr:hypothetical protein [Gammaproteobacteria bacterium]
MFFKNIRREAVYEKIAQTLVARHDIEKMLSKLNAHYPDVDMMPKEILFRVSQGYDAQMHLDKVMCELIEKAYRLGITDDEITSVMRAKGLAHIIDEVDDEPILEPLKSDTLPPKADPVRAHDRASSLPPRTLAEFVAGTVQIKLGEQHNIDGGRARIALLAVIFALCNSADDVEGNYFDICNMYGLTQTEAEGFSEFYASADEHLAFWITNKVFELRDEALRGETPAIDEIIKTTIEIAAQEEFPQLIGDLHRQIR